MKETIRDTVFFDLDGTLLPLKMSAFMKSYMEKLEALEDGAHSGLNKSMMQQGFCYMMSDTHPNCSNRDAFFSFMQEKADVPEDVLEAHLLNFYGKPFDELKVFTHAEPISAQVVAALKDKGYRLVLATNPVFPYIVTEKRIEWAGLDIADFDYITTYENANFTKPHLNYYREILTKMNLSGDQCYMIGNNVTEDLCTVSLGFKTFLLTDYLIGNIDEAPECEKGNYSDLKKWAESLPRV